MDSTKLCDCGCGQFTSIAGYNDARRGVVRGRPQRYVAGHSSRRAQDRDILPYVIEDRGYKTPCWIWTKSVARKRGGYGILQYGGKVWMAHRLSYLRHYGSLPKGLYICHHCDVPACLRPDHLFAGTAGDNFHDMVHKGRENRARGERQARAKLTADAVSSIRNRYAAGNVLMRELADEYGVKEAAIGSIIRRRTWKHL